MTSVFLLKNFQKKRILEGEVSLKEQYILAKNKKKTAIYIFYPDSIKKNEKRNELPVSGTKASVITTDLTETSKTIKEHYENYVNNFNN